MEIQGKVVCICEPQKFNGKNGEFTKFGFVIKTEEQFAKKVHFQVFGDERWANMAIKANEDLTVSFDISSREWNGKWFTSCDAWRVLRNGQQAQTPTQQQTAAPVQQSASPANNPTDDNLPF